jgi:hypothetical protein
MNGGLALCIFLLGGGVGVFLTWLQQRALRKRFQQELEARVDQALFSRIRGRKVAEVQNTLSKALPHNSGLLESDPTKTDICNLRGIVPIRVPPIPN